MTNLIRDTRNDDARKMIKLIFLRFYSDISREENSRGHVELLLLYAHPNSVWIIYNSI